MVCALDPAGYPQHLQHLPLFSIFCQPSSALAGLVGFCVLFKIFQYFLTSLVAQLNQVESLFKHQQFHRLMTSAPNSVVVLNCSKRASERERENSEYFIVEGHLTHYKRQQQQKENKYIHAKWVQQQKKHLLPLPLPPPPRPNPPQESYNVFSTL